ncbi:hypothetical protein QZH41_020237 [Actinostola sp. cb2023]|nr:hypothetical protein QZH41_020237 [Actinostola sp. cb2023]
MTSPSGTIFSPRYPAYYPPNMWCTWELEVPEGKLIRLSFDDVRLGKCSSSSIEIRDKASNKVISRLCDYPSTPHIIFSSGSGLVVQFKSSNDANSGFTAHYDTIQHQHLPLSISCGQNSQIRKLEGSSGSIASYEYPLKYQNDVKCTWMIQTSSSYRFKIKFDFLDIEPSPGCKDDYVAIRDGGYSFSDVMGTFCGAKKPEPLTSSEKLNIRGI